MTLLNLLDNWKLYFYFNYLFFNLDAVGYFNYLMGFEMNGESLKEHERDYVYDLCKCIFD